jgi:hypothetical protein
MQNYLNIDCVFAAEFDIIEGNTIKSRWPETL